MNTATIASVAMIVITLARVEGSLNPSGAWRIYPNVIKVHNIAGRSVMI